MEENTKRKPHARGPAYPFISLEKALERADVLRIAEGRNAAPSASAFKAWGYGGKSSGGRQTLGALNHYGLVEYVGKSEVRVTGLGLKILLDREPNSNERIKMIQQAALLPAIHAEIWKRYGRELPSDLTLQTFLERDRRFTERGAKEVIHNYKDTIRFAKLDEPDKMPPESGQEEDENEGQISIGDYIQWESQGALRFPQPLRVREILEEDGYLYVEGSNAGIPMNEVNLADPPASGSGEKPGEERKPPPIWHGVEEAKFPLKEGLATLQWPGSLSKESFEDFKAWVELILRKAERSISDSDG